MQRIFMKVIKLVRMSNDLAQKDPAFVQGSFPRQSAPSADYWQAENPGRIFMREKDVRVP
jgi:hypothetical protein